MSHYTVLAAVELPEPDVEYLSQNRLALQVEGQLDDLLAPYEEGTNNPDYLEFVDMEESARLEYLTQTMLCVKMPDGRILPAYSGVFSNLYEIYDNQEKNSIISNRMKAPTIFCLSKCFPNFHNPPETNVEIVPALEGDHQR